MTDSPTIPPRPASFSIYDHHVFYNMTDVNGVQRGTMGKQDYGALWQKFRQSWKDNHEYLQGAGGIGFETGKQNAIISKQQWEGE